VKARELTAVEFYSQIGAKEVMQLFGWKSKTTLWKKVAEGKIPEPRYPEPHEPRWRLGEVVEVLEKQPKMKDAPRGLTDRAEVDVAIPSVSNKKSQSVWERLGLSRPK
jgi:predicted DNA-binding transcriptional regulator AlpA